MTIRAMFAKGFPYYGCARVCSILLSSAVSVFFCFCIRGMCLNERRNTHPFLCVFAFGTTNGKNEVRHCMYACLHFWICTHGWMGYAHVCNRLEFLHVYSVVDVSEKNNFAESERVGSQRCQCSHMESLFLRDSGYRTRKPLQYKYIWSNKMTNTIVVNTHTHPFIVLCACRLVCICKNDV